MIFVGKNKLNVLLALFTQPEHIDSLNIIQFNNIKKATQSKFQKKKTEDPVFFFSRWKLLSELNVLISLA